MFGYSTQYLIPNINIYITSAFVWSFFVYFYSPSPPFLYKFFEDIIDHDFYFLCHALKILVYILHSGCSGNTIAIQHNSVQKSRGTQMFKPQERKVSEFMSSNHHCHIWDFKLYSFTFLDTVARTQPVNLILAAKQSDNVRIHWNI